MKKKTICLILITDTMFLLDVKQINTVYNNSSILGSNYYIGTPTAEAVSNSEYKDSSLTSTTKWWSWLRSPSAYYGCGYDVRYVVSDDVPDYNAYYGDGGVRPAFFLNLTSFNLKGDGTEEFPFSVDETAYENTYDGGYYTELDDDPMSEITGGILAFSSKYNLFEENKDNISRYGFLVYNQANEYKRATIESNTVVNLNDTNGKFTIYLQVPKANLSTYVVAKPFVIVSGETIWGDIMATSVAELDKWLGRKPQ